MTLVATHPPGASTGQGCDPPPHGPVLSQAEIAQLNDMASFFSFKYVPINKRFLTLPHKIICSFTGNQFGKTAMSTYSVVLSILGRHPVVERNFDYYKCASPSCKGKWNAAKTPRDGVCPLCRGTVKPYFGSVRTVRFASETLPGDTMDEKGQVSTETRNTLYPEFKRWLPPFLIKKDITSRSPKMVVKSAVGGPDIVVEFVSYGQSVQSTAGSQRFIIVCDEEPPYPFWSEQLPRLLAADGWMMLALTPANYISWTHDELFERASAYFRSKTIVDKFGLPQVEVMRDDNAIAVVQAATDDNPTLRPDVVERLFENYNDEDELAIRRFGVFKQVSGRIFKDFDKVHIIDGASVFPEGINEEWFHARGCDYHGRNPWAIGWVALSPDDELFVYDEMAPSPEKSTTDAIAKEVAEKSGDCRFRLDLVDPLIKSANGKESPRPDWSVLDDFNAAFSRLRKAGVGTGGHWEAWDTKSERGRDAIKVRLKNSIACGKPFSNIQYKEGVRVVLPTIWVFSKCKEFTQSLRSWRYEEWQNTGANRSKEDKNTPSQKHSHFCMVLEGLLKDARFRPERKRTYSTREFKDDRYFRRGAHR